MATLQRFVLNESTPVEKNKDLLLNIKVDMVKLLAASLGIHCDVLRDNESNESERVNAIILYEKALDKLSNMFNSRTKHTLH